MSPIAFNCPALIFLFSSPDLSKSELYFRINNKSYTTFEQSLLDKLVDTSCEFVVSVIYYQEDSWQVILNNFEYFPIKK